MLIWENRRIIVKELALILDVSVGSLGTFVKTHVHYRKVGSHAHLSMQNKMVRMQMASQLLGQFEEECEQFLKSIGTTDKTWVHYFIPESQQSTKERHHRDSPKPKKPRTTISAGKVMATIFWDWKGVTHLDFLQERRANNAEYYSNILVGEVKDKIWYKRKLDFLPSRQCKASHCQKTMETIRKLKRDLLPHPPYRRIQTSWPSYVQNVRWVVLIASVVGAPGSTRQHEVI